MTFWKWFMNRILELKEEEEDDDDIEEWMNESHDDWSIHEEPNWRDNELNLN